MPPRLAASKSSKVRHRKSPKGGPAADSQPAPTAGDFPRQFLLDSRERFAPITEATQLPPEGEDYDRTTIHPTPEVPADGFCLAADVAALANNLGGTVLVGAQESDGCVGRYRPLNKHRATAIEKAISSSVRDLCLPHPDVVFAHIARARGIVLAVNVWPRTGPVIGVAAKSTTDDTSLSGHAYLFPVWTGIAIVYLKPHQLPKVRRTVVLLQMIPKGAAVRILLGVPGSEDSVAQYEGFMGELEEAGNAVSFSKATQQISGSKPVPKLVVPLDQVKSVLRDARGWLAAAYSYASKREEEELSARLADMVTNLRRLAIETQSQDVAKILVIQQALLRARASDANELAKMYKGAEAFLKRRGEQPLIPSNRLKRTAGKRAFVTRLEKILKTVPAPLPPHELPSDCVAPQCHARVAAFRILTELLHEDGWLAVAGYPRDEAEDAIVGILHKLQSSPDAETVAEEIVRAAYDRPTENHWKYLQMETKRKGAKSPGKPGTPAA